MNSFSYFHNGKPHKASFSPYVREGYDRYKVTLDDGTSFVMARFGINPRFWLQAVQQKDEINYPHDLVQAIGEGLELKLLDNI